MTSPTYSIMVARPEEATHIAGFQVAMAGETEEYELNHDIVKRGVKRIFKEPERGFYVVTHDGLGHTVASLLVVREWSDWRNADVWWIHSVYVVPEHRRKGVFRRMFEWLEIKARKEGVAGLRLYVEKENSRARTTYESLGMKDDHYDLYEKWL